MAKNQSPPLSEDEIRCVYRNEFYEIDSDKYYKHKCTGYRSKRANTYKKNTDFDKIRAL